MADALYAIQQRFLAAIMGEDADAEALIIDDARVGAARRIGIYRNNYRASLTGVLADHFERLHAYLGDAQFG
ncbi:MAG TPA: DNA-binding domain-containing protein, partial [Sphingopyxis terrae]|nr:DNA-binding domain-containing protein [Sphingopyxis terrae]